MSLFIQIITVLLALLGLAALRVAAEIWLTWKEERDYEKKNYAKDKLHFLKDE